MFARLTPELREERQVFRIARDPARFHLAIHHARAAIGIVEERVIIDERDEFRLFRQKSGAIGDLHHGERFLVFAGRRIEARQLNPVAALARPEVDHFFEQRSALGAFVRLGIHEVEQVVVLLLRFRPGRDRVLGRAHRRTIVRRLGRDVGGGKKVISVGVDRHAITPRLRDPLVQALNGGRIIFQLHVELRNVIPNLVVALGIEAAGGERLLEIAQGAAIIFKLILDRSAIFVDGRLVERLHAAAARIDQLIELGERRRILRRLGVCKFKNFLKNLRGRRLERLRALASALFAFFALPVLGERSGRNQRKRRGRPGESEGMRARESRARQKRPGNGFSQFHHLTP